MTKEPPAATTFVVGIDGCHRGWFTVTLREPTGWQVAVFSQIAEIWRHLSAAGLILIDLPIGLPSSGPPTRRCDRAARRLLGFPRSTSVFPTPCRPVLTCPHRPSASELNLALCGRRLSGQTWGLLPKIQEVDGFLRTNSLARRKIRETHPEVLFWALNHGRAMVHKKSRPEGFQERLAVLKKYFPPSETVAHHALSNFPRSRVAPHDVLDALAAAVTALLGHDRLAVLPPEPEYDALGLPMEIVYFRP